MRKTYILREPVMAHKVITEALWPSCKGWLVANGTPLVITVSRETRSSEENRLLHLLIGEVSKHLVWAGEKRSSEVVKRLLVAAWCRTRGESVEVLPALDGHGVDIIPTRTSKLNKGECADLIDFVTCFMVEQNIPVPALED